MTEKKEASVNFLVDYLSAINSLEKKVDEKMEAIVAGVEAANKVKNTNKDLFLECLVAVDIDIDMLIELEKGIALKKEQMFGF